MPQSVVERTLPESLVPAQSAQGASFRNFATRLRPFSSLTFDSAFSTV